MWKSGVQTLAGLIVYTYKQVTEFTLDSEDYLERNPLCRTVIGKYGRVLMLPSEGGREREGVRTGEFLVGSGLLVTFINSVLFSILIAEYREAPNRRNR